MDRRAFLTASAVTASGLAIRAAARLNAVEIAIDIKLQQHRRMIRRTTRQFGSDPPGPAPGKLKLVDKDIDRPNRVALANPVFQDSGKIVVCSRSVPSTKRPI